jgi:hypothetical protein
MKGAKDGCTGWTAISPADERYIVSIWVTIGADGTAKTISASHGVVRFDLFGGKYLRSGGKIQWWDDGE